MDAPAIAAMAMTATSVGSDGFAGARKMAIASVSKISSGESQAHARLPVVARRTWYTAAAKKIIVAYITATNRRLSESDDKASIASAVASTSTRQYSVIAGTSNGLSRRKAGLPAKI